MRRDYGQVRQSYASDVALERLAHSLGLDFEGNRPVVLVTSLETWVCAGPGRSCFGNESDEKQRDGGESVAKAFSTECVPQEVVDGDGMAEQAELVASHVLNATKDVLADLREQIVEARIELEGVNSKLAERKAELAATVGHSLRQSGSPTALGFCRRKRWSTRPFGAKSHLRTRRSSHGRGWNSNRR